MKFSEIFQVNFNPQVGTEIMKSRPAVIVGDDAAFKNLKLRLVVPVRHFEPKFKGNPFLPILEPSKRNGLKKVSMVDCLQVKSVSIERFEKLLGTVDDDELLQIRIGIALALKMKL